MPCHNSMIVAAWLYPAHAMTGEPLKARLHVGHVIEWVFLFNGPPLFLVLPQKLKELGLEFILLNLRCTGVVKLEIGSHVIV